MYDVVRASKGKGIGHGCIHALKIEWDIGEIGSEVIEHTMQD